MSKQPNVVIVHDWLVGGGAERVVMELHKIYPEAPIYTSYCTDEWREKLDGKVVTGWLQHLGRVRKFIPLLRIWWFSTLDLHEFDLIISSSGNGEAKSVKKASGATHICYCHAPTHFYWRHYDQYLREPGFGLFNPLVRLALRILVGPLRTWDKKAATRPDYFIANSTHTANEIKEFYDRSATVIHPPVDVERFAVSGNRTRKGFVTAGRQTPYKRTDIIVEACTRLGVPLTVIGRGPEHQKLRKLAGPTVNFRNNVTDDEMAGLIAQHEAFIFAAYEDFGITPVEALSTGTPVIAYGKGGALDYVKPSLTGSVFMEQSVKSLCAALQSFDASSYNAPKIRAFAQEFSAVSFRKRIRDYVQKKI